VEFIARRPSENCVQQAIPIPEEGNLKKRCLVNFKCGCRQPFRNPSSLVYKPSPVEWNAFDVALLTALWTKGHSAGQIATRLRHSRNAVCAKLLRMGLKRGHKPPTAKPKIMSVTKRRPVLLATCARPAAKIVSRRISAGQPTERTKSQLNAMLAEAAANTARQLR
jgi:GcrA cell cycle regulator